MTEPEEFATGGYVDGEQVFNLLKMSRLVDTCPIRPEWMRAAGMEEQENA